MSNILCIEPMKINKIPEGKENLLPSICASGEYFAQIKKDGYWYQFEKQEGMVYLWSRTISKVTGTLAEKGANVPHIMEILAQLPTGTVIIGEIYYPGKESKDVTPIMGALPEKAIERQKGEYGPLHYYIHDMIYYNGRNLIDIGAAVRYDLLKKVYEKYRLGDFEVNGEQIIELAERFDDNILDKINEVLAAGEEGMVLKKKTAPYSPGKRPAWDTLKIKKTDGCDAILMGFNPPTVNYDGKLDIGADYTGKDSDNWSYWAQFEYEENNVIKLIQRIPIGVRDTVNKEKQIICPVTKAFYYGWPTAIRIGAYDENNKLIQIGTVSSGLTEELMQDFVDRPLKYLNTVVELRGMEKHNEDHTLRHFYFKGFRDDKDPTECTIESIFGG